MNYDFDYIIVGSGFGGSVSALRLSEKGYKVLVIEKGKRWSPVAQAFNDFLLGPDAEPLLKSLVRYPM